AERAVVEASLELGGGADDPEPAAVPQEVGGRRRLERRRLGIERRGERYVVGDAEQVVHVLGAGDEDGEEAAGQPALARPRKVDVPAGRALEQAPAEAAHAEQRVVVPVDDLWERETHRSMFLGSATREERCSASA